MKLETIGKVLKCKQFWLSIFLAIAVLILALFARSIVMRQERQQVGDAIIEQCDRVEEVQINVLKDARDRNRPTFVLTVPNDFSEEEREEVESIVEQYYEKYYYIFYE